ncbi:MAG: hypothetical protein J1G01_03840 [Clostridiales bacterium]|nr:hypothetical protein [Clostridiales bacterium]
MKTMTFKFVDGTSSTVEISDELADVYEKIIKYEKKVHRKDTRRHTSIDAMKEYGYEVVDPDADIDEIIEREELLQLEQERNDRELRKEEKKQARQLKYLTERLTHRQAQAYFEFTYLKLKKVEIAKNMHITEGAVRKLILKAEENLEKLRQKEIEEDEAELARIQEKIKDNVTLLSAQEKVRTHKKLTKEENDALNLHMLQVLFGEI